VVDVVLLDREMLPRYKVCGGGLVHRVLQFLPTDVTTAVERQCAVAEVNLLPYGYHFESRRHVPVVSMTMRAEFDWLLVDAARQAGARIVYPCEVRGITWCTDEARLDTTAGSLYARFVIAADGAAGHLARFGGFHDKRIMAPALEWEVTVPPEILVRFGQAARFDIGAVSNGYGWVFPKREHLSVGVCVLHSPCSGRRSLKQALQDYLAAAGVAPVLSAQKHGYVIPLTPREGPLGCQRMLLVGDAAGLARDLSGEGIGPAIRSGRLAAAAAADFVRRGTDLDGYARQIVALYGRGEPGWLERQIGRLPQAAGRLIVRLALGSSFFRRRVVFDSIFGMREVMS